MLESDKNNKTLFSNILPYIKPADFEGPTRPHLDHQGEQRAQQTADKGDGAISADHVGGAARGRDGRTDAARRPASRRTASKGLSRHPRCRTTRRKHSSALSIPAIPTCSDQRYPNADEVIAALQPVFPSPDDLAAATPQVTSALDSAKGGTRWRQAPSASPGVCRLPVRQKTLAASPSAPARS